MTDYFLSEFTGWFDFLYSSFTLVTKSYLYKPSIRQPTTTFLKEGGEEKYHFVCQNQNNKKKKPLFQVMSQVRQDIVRRHYQSSSYRRTWPGRVLPCNRWSIWINVSSTGSQSYNLRSCDSDDVRCFSCCSSSSSQPCTSAKTQLDKHEYVFHIQ